MHGSIESDPIDLIIGMSIDLGINDYIDKRQIQDKNNPISNPNITNKLPSDTPVSWSIANAVTWSGYLPSNLNPLAGPINDQQQALRNFLSLYAVTRSGNAAWNDLNNYIKNNEGKSALFGDGSGMISHVHLGGVSSTATPNPYDAMNLVLNKLGIKSEPNSNHNTHIHLDIAAPAIVPLPHNLLADSIVPNAAQMETVRAAAQTIAEGAQSNFGFTQGDLNMLFMDMPNVPPQYAPVIVAQATQAQQQGTERTMGLCQPIENKEESRSSAINGLSPVGDAMTYLEKFGHLKFDNYEAVFYAGKITILQAPMHGELKLGQNSGAYYSKDYSYEGPDTATVLVEVGGYKIKVIYHFVLMQNVPGSSDQGTATDDKSICPNGEMWKVSTTLDNSGNVVVNSVDYLPATPSTPDTLTNSSLTDWLSLAQQDGALANLTGLAIQSGIDSASGTTTNSGPSITVSVADLPGAAVGQTTGTNITLDTNAADNGWFIDTTPADNSEFLPTADPNVWIAKQGSAAAGKMDMLSVLLHEYGHALGIEHSANPYDFMGATLLPGEY